MRNRQFLVVAFILLLALAFAASVQQNGSFGPRTIEFSELVALVDEGKVDALTIQGSDVDAVLKDGARVHSTGPEESDFYLRYFAEKGVTPNFKEEGDASWFGIALNAVLLLITVAMFLFLLRQLQVGNGRAMAFGKSRARLLSDSGKKVTFADVAGCDEAKEELEEIIQFLKDPRRFTRLGGRIPKGVLLMGAPGTGKTLLARAVAGEAAVPFFSISGSEFVEMFVGVGASRVRDLFEQAKKQAPCIIFIDEIDAVGRHRGAGLGGGHDEREQTLNQLLVEMDGFDSGDGVIIVAATNRPDVLDPALLRPGRFDRRVIVPPPDVRGRLGILQVHARRVPLEDGVDLEHVARGTSGFSGAELESLVNEAALIAARQNKKKVDQLDLEHAKDKVAMGAERRSLVRSEYEKRRTAYHEAGHALVARFIPESDPVNKITIVPRGQALGLTQFTPEEQRYGATRHQLAARLAMAMGGRAAEEIVFNEISTGAQGDIKNATRMAHAMVCEWGMSDELGPVAWGEKQEEIFLGRDYARRQSDYSEHTAQRIDAEVRRIIGHAYDRARGILQTHIGVLHKVAQTLLEKETIDRHEFESLVSPFLPPPEGASA